MKKKLFASLIFCHVFLIKGQIANYVNNGGFETVIPNVNPYTPKGWRSIDSSSFYGVLLSSVLPPFNVPMNSYAYQWPKGGNNYFATDFFFPTGSIRGYPLNRLKANLNSGATYCVKFYCNITNQSSYGIDGFSVYFGNVSIDTISYCTDPLTYLTPQIQNPAGNIIVDTLHWVPVTGTFVANGSEKYMILGNFRSDVATSTMMINPTNLPQVFCDILIDDVSCIDINLPAFAGRDTTILPGSNVFLGRESDIGIDEACIWYKLPDTTNPIDTIAGFWINPTSTATYVVKQQLWCTNAPKWDTVVVKADPTVGYVSSSGVENDIELFPNPANNFLELKTKNPDLGTNFDRILIYNNLGQSVKEVPIAIGIRTNLRTEIRIEDLPEGIYTLQLIGNSGTAYKRFVIAR